MFWRTLIKRFVGATIYLVISFASLAVVFPIADGANGQYRSWARAITEYLRMSLIVTAIVVVLVPLITWWCRKLPLGIAVIVRMLCVFGALAYMAETIGTSHDLITLPPTSRISDFFSELRFLVFIYIYGTAVSVFAGGYYWWNGSLVNRNEIRVGATRKPRLEQR
jgi:hypothetical protein